MSYIKQIESLIILQDIDKEMGELHKKLEDACQLKKEVLKSILKTLPESIDCIFDIQNKYLRELNSKMNSDNGLMISFMEEIKKALSEISNYFIFFDGNINFLEQPEFDSKKEIISFLGLMQRQDLIFSKMQEKAKT